MPSGPPDKSARDANLDALEQAVTDYVGQEKTRLSNEVKFIRSVMQGRNLKSAAIRNLEEGTRLAQADIDAFLTGAGS